MAYDAQTRLRELLPQLEYETLLLHRIIYKNRNQHRRCGYFRHLARVAKLLNILQAANLNRAMQDSIPILKNPNDEVAAASKNPQPFVTLDIPANEHGGANLGRVWDAVVRLMWSFLGIARLLKRMQYPILQASSQIATLLGQSFFMPFALTVFAILSRLRVLLLQAFHDVIIVYNLLSHGCNCKMKVSMEGADCGLAWWYLQKRVISVQGLKVEDNLPVWLVCRAKEERLYLHEITSTEPPGFLDSEIFPSSQWFQDVSRKVDLISEPWIQQIFKSNEHRKEELKQTPAVVKAKSAKSPSPLAKKQCNFATDLIKHKRKWVSTLTASEIEEGIQADAVVQVSGSQNSSLERKKLKTATLSFEEISRKKKELLDYLEQPSAHGTPTSRRGTSIGSFLDTSSQGSKRKVAYVSVVSSSQRQLKSTEDGDSKDGFSGDVHRSQLAATTSEINQGLNNAGGQVKPRTDNLFEMLLGDRKFDSLF